MSDLSDRDRWALGPGLDAYQEQEREWAAEREAEGDLEARRPDAVREQVAFRDVRVGDFITAEDGPAARWAEVVRVQASPKVLGAIEVTFRVPQPIGVGMHDEWVIDWGEAVWTAPDLFWPHVRRATEHAAIRGLILGRL